MSDTASGIVTFALPDESRPFVRALTKRRKLPRLPLLPFLPVWFGRHAGRLLAVVHTGVGDTPAGRERLQATLTAAKGLRWVISAGYAGGLSPLLRVGDLLLGENHSDPALLLAALALLADHSPHVGALLTQTAAVETAAEKRTLHVRTGALAVDMETAWISEVCAGAGVPLLSLRVISDAADQSFPIPGHILFDAARQRPRYLALPLYLLTHPARLAPFMRFVRDLAPARARLTHSLDRLVAAL